MRHYYFVIYDCETQKILDMGVIQAKSEGEAWEVVDKKVSYHSGDVCADLQEIEVIQNFNEWNVKEGDYVDLYELGAVRNARLIKMGGKIYLCGYWLITGFEDELGVKEEELEETAIIRDETGRAWYPACAYLVELADRTEIAEWDFEGLDALMFINIS